MRDSSPQVRGENKQPSWNDDVCWYPAGRDRCWAPATKELDVGALDHGGTPQTLPVCGHHYHTALNEMKDKR